MLSERLSHFLTASDRCTSGKLAIAMPPFRLSCLN